MSDTAELFEDAYKPFGELPDDYPRHEYTPLFRGFHGRAHVVSGVRYKRRYLVDLTLNECTCQKGNAVAWTNKGTAKKPDGYWYNQAYCTHKLSMMASIIAGWKVKATLPDAEQAYVKALATRYNPFEAVSAFHKEVRRGDFEQAWFWGLVLSAKRGMTGVTNYLLNIVYEETRDHALAEHLITLSQSRSNVTMQTMAAAIAWFCASPKKWELPHRFAIFQDEMRGYDSLVKSFSPDVAKGAGIIPSENETALKRDMSEGFKAKDWPRFQRGWKGLQKMVFADKHSSLDDYRHYLYEFLYDFADERLSETHPVWTVVAVVNARIEAGNAAGYHELNAIADAIMGEPASAGLLPPERVKRLLARPTPGIPYAKWPPIPLYAHDNHTWGGKALMRRFGHQLKPGAEQTDLDFRWCGAYFGVCYRTLCFDQHRKVLDVPWSEVKWPKELQRIVESLWY